MGGGRNGVGKAPALLQVCACGEPFPLKRGHRPHDKMPLRHKPRVGLALHQIDELLCPLACGRQPSPGQMNLREPPEDPGELRRLPHLLVQRIGPGVDLAHVRGPHPRRGPQQIRQGELERELAPDALGALRQRRQQCERFPQGGDRFVMGIPLRGVVPHLLPIVHGLMRLARPLEVHGQLGRDLPGVGAIARL